MMNCEECSEKLTFLVFGEPTTQEMDILEHIAECDTCREEYIELLEVESKLSENMSDATVADLTLGSGRKKSVIAEAAKIDGEMKRDFQSSTFKQFPVFITTLAACIVISFIWYNKKEEKRGSTQDVVMEKAADTNSRRKSESATKEVLEEEVSDADAPVDDAAKLERLVKSAPLKKRSSSTRAFRAKEAAVANELKKEGSKDALALEEKTLKPLLQADKKMKLEEAKFKADVADEVPAEKKAAGAAPASISWNSGTLVEKWLAANKDDKAVQTTAEYLQKWGYDNIALTPVKIKEESALKIILQKKNEKPIDYGFFFIHNGEIIRFKPMTEVEIK
jgi:hypothetical protein